MNSCKQVYSWERQCDKRGMMSKLFRRKAMVCLARGTGNQAPLALRFVKDFLHLSWAPY